MRIFLAKLDPVGEWAGSIADNGFLKRIERIGERAGSGCLAKGGKKWGHKENGACHFASSRVIRCQQFVPRNSIRQQHQPLRAVGEWADNGFLTRITRI